MSVDRKLVTNYKGEDIFLISLTNAHGCIVAVTNFGAIIKDFLVPQADGKLANMVLTYENISGYFDDPHYIGCTVGRYANRIAAGSFELNNEPVQLTINELSNTNHLHGGFTGFNKRVWTVSETFEGETGSGVVLKLSSQHLEEGYPGNLQVELRYTLTDANKLILTYKATTDRPTVVNLTNHSYFNLSGGTQDISTHILSIKSNQFTPANKQYIPSGEISAVESTTYDLQQGKKVKDLMHQVVTLNYCLDNQGELKLAAVLTDPASRVSLQVSTTCPGLQLYFGNYLDGSFAPFSGLCLEPQHYPDSPNHANFPSAQLLPGEVYQEITVYQFITETS